MPERIKATTGVMEILLNGIVEIWLWVTIGLLAIMAFFGRRLLKRWDHVIDSHMPDHEIELKMDGLRKDMLACQEKLAKEQTKTQGEIINEVSSVHQRLDKLYELLLQKGQ